MKRILLAVSGLNPQVITETFYALHQQGRTPDSIRILTTREGKAAIHANLLSPDNGYYYKLLSDYGISPDTVQFSSRHLHAATDQFGTEYDDIAGEEENEHFLSLCMTQAFECTKEPDTEVYFSIAGGRKTMGACLAIAAQCYARPQDRIFHVLLTPEFESCRDFYYPPPVSLPLILKDRRTGTPYTKETRYAEITLVPLPFFSIRDRLTDSHLKQPESPASLMLSLVRENSEELLIDVKQRKIIWKGREMDMMPARMALYAMFAFLKKDSECHKEKCPGCDACSMTISSILQNDCNVAELYRKHLSPYRDHEGMSTTGIRGLSAENFNSYRTRINHDIESAFGPVEA
ncbi:MAG: CRISPR-associated ring nuclease Csm6, partial [Desulfuromonadaceae bacterium]|nr:CRISPR-associated ring nuclease Csm6 [Desulfuromonadaceae bacterium]